MADGELHDDDRRAGWGRRDYDHQVSLQYYTERLIREMDRRLEKIEALLEKLDDKQDTFITLGYYDERHDKLEERLDSVEKWQENIQGRWIAISVLGGIFIAGMGTFIGYLLH